MIIRLIPPSIEYTVVGHLPEPDMVVDTRPITCLSFGLEETVQAGTALTVTRTHRLYWGLRPGWDLHIPFRIYSRNERRYSVNSTTYLLHGLRHEYATLDVTEVIIKDGLDTIRQEEFIHRSSLRKVTIPNTITTIEMDAFWGCESLVCLQLPPNLQHIGDYAFHGCSSLQAFYVPPTVTHIGTGAFKNCKSLRIINFPDNVQDIYLHDFIGCDDLLTDEMKASNYYENDQWFRNRYSSFHNLCWDPSIMVDRIQEYMQEHDDDQARARTKDKPRFTPLHLLAANPSVTGEMITAYLSNTSPDVALLQNNLGMTLLHMLCSSPYFSGGAIRAYVTLEEGRIVAVTEDQKGRTTLQILSSGLNFSDASGGAIRAYLAFEEGRIAAFVKDDEGRTPFDRFCENHFGPSFGSVMLIWYHCLGINFFAEASAPVHIEIRE